MNAATIDPKQLREAKGLTQVELSILADLSTATVSRFEVGRLVSPSLRTRRKLAEAYGLSTSEVERAIGPTSNTPGSESVGEGNAMVDGKVAGGCHPDRAGAHIATAS